MLRRLTTRLKATFRRRIGGYRTFVVLEHPTVQEPPAQEARIPVHFTWIGPPEVDALDRPGLDFSARDVATGSRRLEQGDECLVGFVDDQPTTYLWVTYTMREMNSFTWPVGQDRAFIYKTFTAPLLRRNGLNAAAMSLGLRRCHQRGVKRVFIDVARSNVPSLLAIRKAGFADVGVYHALRLIRWRKAFVPSPLFRVVAGNGEGLPETLSRP